MRQRQQDRHAFEAEQRESNCKTAMWTTRRHAELDLGTTRDRMAHLEKDMKHAHVLDQHETRRYLGPQMMSMRPLVPKRAGHATSSSSLRGTLLSAATAEGRAAVSSLTSTHDFSDSGALNLGTAEALTMDRTSRMAARTARSEVRTAHCSALPATAHQMCNLSPVVPMGSGPAAA